MDALVTKNSQLFLHFVCHCLGIAAPEEDIDGDCDKDMTLCAELDVRAVEEGSESANLCCGFLNPCGDFQLILEVA